jgi:hypothetical protein
VHRSTDDSFNFSLGVMPRESGHPVIPVGRAIDRLERELGFSGQPRVVVVHEKQGREHTHVVWSRTDLERGRAIPIDHNFRKHELVARELEREFGHARVQGAHIEREGRARPKRTPSYAEMHQAARTGLRPQEVKKHVTEIWQRSDSGRAFAKGLAEAGFVLARGIRRDFVVIDPQGGTHSLARRIEGATAKDVRARLADLDPGMMPSVQEAKQAQKERRAPGLDHANAPPGGRAQDAGQVAHAPRNGSRQKLLRQFGRASKEGLRAGHARDGTRPQG